MKKLIFSFIAVTVTSLPAFSATKGVLATRYSCNLVNAAGMAKLSYQKPTASSEPYQAILQYGFLRTTFQGGIISFYPGRGTLASPSLTTGRLSSDRTKMPYVIFLQPAAVQEGEQVLSGVIGYSQALGLILNPFMMNPFYMPASYLGFVVPMVGFVPTAAVTCRLQFELSNY